jgi:hypothetical protein
LNRGPSDNPGIHGTTGDFNLYRDVDVLAVVKQLKPVGKAADFERMILYDRQYVHKYLNQVIPGYYACWMNGE